MNNWKCIVPERYEKEIVTHIAKVYNENINESPLILGIDGPPGEGKTYQCKLILKRLGFEIFSVSAGEFESKDAGEPTQLVRSKYKSAHDYVLENENNFAAILIDDVDVALGNWGDSYQYTVNTQSVIGELMHLADKSKELDDINGVRIPIIMTGNDLSKLYAPLKRDGRMNLFYWKPNITEKIRIVYFIFDFLNEEECASLVEFVDEKCTLFNLQESSIAFYSTLKNDLYNDSVWNNYLKLKRNNLFEEMINVKELLPSINSTPTLEEIEELAFNKIEQLKLANTSHLPKNGIE